MARHDETKKALARALKGLLRTTPLDRITVTQLARACGVNRQTFYYHFSDIYSLVGWIYETEAEDAVGGCRTYETWQSGLRATLEYLASDRSFVMGTYRSVNPWHARRFLDRIVRRFIGGVVDEQAHDSGACKDDREFIARFFAHGFEGLILDWIDDGMREDPARLVGRLELVVRGGVAQALGRLGQPRAPAPQTPDAASMRQPHR